MATFKTLLEKNLKKAKKKKSAKKQLLGKLRAKINKKAFSDIEENYIDLATIADVHEELFYDSDDAISDMNATLKYENYPGADDAVYLVNAIGQIVANTQKQLSKILKSVSPESSRYLLRASQRPVTASDFGVGSSPDFSGDLSDIADSMTATMSEYLETIVDDAKSSALGYFDDIIENIKDYKSPMTDKIVKLLRSSNDQVAKVIDDTSEYLSDELDRDVVDYVYHSGAYDEMPSDYEIGRY